MQIYREEVQYDLLWGCSYPFMAIHHSTILETSLSSLSAIEAAALLTLEHWPNMSISPKNFF